MLESLKTGARGYDYGNFTGPEKDGMASHAFLQISRRLWIRNSLGGSGGSRMASGEIFRTGIPVKVSTAGSGSHVHSEGMAGRLAGEYFSAFGRSFAVIMQSAGLCDSRFPQQSFF